MSNLDRLHRYLSTPEDKPTGGRTFHIDDGKGHAAHIQHIFDHMMKDPKKYLGQAAQLLHEYHIENYKEDGGGDDIPFAHPDELDIY